MPSRVILKRVLPFVGFCGGLAVATIAIDAGLHAVGFSWIGRYLGILGTLLILASLTYSLRKHGKIKWGKPRLLLSMHEWIAWLGASLVLVHAGVHVEAALPWLATAAMCVNVLSGLVGKFLLTGTRDAIAKKRKKLIDTGAPTAEIEEQLLGEISAMRVMSRWRSVHIPIFLVFVVTALGHIISIFIFWNWR